MEAIVAVNHATGLRYLIDDDHTVRTWVSPMHLKYLTGEDIDVVFHPGDVIGVILRSVSCHHSDVGCLT